MSQAPEPAVLQALVSNHRSFRRYGPIEMGGMFTVLKVRDDITSYEDPGWYEQPEGAAAWRVE